MSTATHPPYRSPAAGVGRVQSGAAALLVVMLLFFIMSMVAAYTSRNLIFEQKTSANQLRSTQSFEAADAGLQWALGLLNSGRIDGVCQPSTDLANNTFRQRYLTISGTDGAVTPVPGAGGSDLLPSCVFNGTNWICSCPATGAPVVATPVGSDIFPAFRVRFKAFTEGAPPVPQVFRIEVIGCTSNSDACLTFAPTTATGTYANIVANEGRSYVTALLTLKGAINSVPVAALTAQGSIDLGGAPTLTVINANPKGSGLTVQAGGAVNTASLFMRTVPGSLDSQAFVQNDASMAAFMPDLMFNSNFGLTRNTYRDQPGAFVIACAGTCTAAQVRTAADQNPGRVLWVEGNLNFDTGGDVGSAADPLAIVVNGNVQFAAAAVVHGVVYVQAANWNTTGGGTIRGAAIAEGAVTGNGTTTIVHDAAALDLVRFRTGTMAVLPGSWRDF